jgi:hypothetical protein
LAKSYQVIVLDLRGKGETDKPAAGGDVMFRKLYRELVRCKRSLFQKAFGPKEMNEFSKLLDLLIRLETE